MIISIRKRSTNLPHKILSAFIAFTFIFSLVLPPGYAQLIPQTLLNLPAPGTMVSVSPAFTPALINGITIHPENPLEFDFIVGTGDQKLQGKAFEEESTRLIKYFLAALTVPEDQMWVNLSPYEKDRIVPQGFGTTEMGRDLLAQDYILKQLTASLMYPEKELGSAFWKKIYQKAHEQYGTTEIPMNTFNKVWIVPEKAVVYEHGNSAFVVKSHLRVMLEEDYLAKQANQAEDLLRRSNDKTIGSRSPDIRPAVGSSGKVMLEEDYMAVSHQSSDVSHQKENENLTTDDRRLTTQVIREVIIPAIEQEVNEGQGFANLRQIYNSVILAAWFKQNFRQTLLGQVYVDKTRTKGVDVEDKEINQKIYAQYLEAFKKGVYNYIKEDYDPATREVIPRKYFSGGTNLKVKVETYKKEQPLTVEQQKIVASSPVIQQADQRNVAINLLELSSRTSVADAQKAIEQAKQLGSPRAAGKSSSPMEAVLPRVNPAATASWPKLKKLAADKTRYDLRTLFDADPKRVERFSVALDDAFKVDLSKNLIDEETLSDLFGLADEARLKEAIEQMFNGEKINETENRAVLHTALRNVTRDANGEIIAADGPVYVDGKDVMPGIIKVLNQMKEFTNKVRSGEWKGATGKTIKHVVNVGIGGSDLGPKMAAEALKPFGRGSGITVHFVSNIDGTAVAELIRELGNPEETLIVIESKTFTTQETIQNAMTLKNWVTDYYKAKEGVSREDAIKKHFVAVSTARELVEAFGIDPENMFAFWDWVGGRYSMWSAIGLTLATFIGFDNFFEMLEGAREADEHFRNRSFDKNIPVLKALLGVWNRNFLNAETNAIFPYDEYLSLLPAFLQQGFMESQGKGTDRSGNFITDYHTGQIIFGAAGTDGQHSFYQSIHQLPSIIPADFIGIARTQNPLPGHHEKLYANFVAQPYALAFGSKLEEVMKALDDGKMSPEELRWLAAHRTFPGNKPTTSIFIDEMTPRALGKLIAMYEHQIMAEGIIYNIFSFDQWGVQLGKVVATKNVLDFLNGTRAMKELNSVPYGNTIRDVVEGFIKKQPSSSPVQISIKAYEKSDTLEGETMELLKELARRYRGDLFSHLDEVNEHPFVAGLKSLKDSPEGDALVMRTDAEAGEKEAYLASRARGEWVKLLPAGGDATRLGLGVPKILLDLAELLSDAQTESLDTAIAKALKKGEITQEQIDEIKKLKEEKHGELRNISILGRILENKARMFDEAVRKKQTFIIVPSDGDENAVAQELIGHRYYGFARESFVIAPQVKNAMYTIEDNQIKKVAAKKAGGNGVPIIETALEGKAYIIGEDGRLQKLLGTALNYAKDRGAKYVSQGTIGDLRSWGDEVLNEEFVGRIFNELSSGKVAAAAEYVKQNPKLPQKGGSVFYHPESGNLVFIEKVAMGRLLKSVDFVEQPLATFNHVFTIAALESIRDKSIPMYVRLEKDRDGKDVLFTELVGGDILMILQQEGYGVAHVERPITIHELKGTTSLIPTIMAAVAQDRKKGPAASPAAEKKKIVVLRDENHPSVISNYKRAALERGFLVIEARNEDEVSMILEMYPPGDIVSVARYSGGSGSVTEDAPPQSLPGDKTGASSPVNVDRLIKDLRDNADEGKRVEAARELGRVRPATDTIIDALGLALKRKGETMPVREAAAGALKEIDTKQAMDLLEQAAKDLREDVKKAASDALKAVSPAGDIDPNKILGWPLKLPHDGVDNEFKGGLKELAERFAGSFKIENAISPREGITITVTLPWEQEKVSDGSAYPSLFDYSEPKLMRSEWPGKVAQEAVEVLAKNFKESKLGKDYEVSTTLGPGTSSAGYDFVSITFKNKSSSPVKMEPLSMEILRSPASIEDGIAWKKRNEYIFGGGFGYDLRINDAQSEWQAAAEFMYAFGRTFGGDAYFHGSARVLVTGDQRATSDAFRLALAQGLADENIEVVTQKEGDVITTGLPSRKGLADDFDLVIQITGSHNPKEGNGVKILSYKGLPFFQNKLLELSTNIERQAGWSKVPRQEGMITSTDLIEEHISDMDKVLPDLKSPPSLVVDFRSGAAGQVFIGLAQRKGYRVVLLDSPEADLPNELFQRTGQPALVVLNDIPSPQMKAGIWDPSKLEAYDGIRRVQQRIYNDPRFQGRGRYAGFAFDGDGDRAGAIDEAGQLVMPERMLMAFYQRMILENEEGIRILNQAGHTVKLALDVRASKVIVDVLKNIARQKGLKIEGEFIAAGFPNHRTYVWEELNTIADHYLAGLSMDKAAAATNVMLNYTSAEASGHFFFRVLSPKKFLQKKSVVDDGITSSFVFLHLIETLNDYEFKGTELIPEERTVAKVDELFKRLPVTNEIRLSNAPSDVVKKQALAEEIIKTFARHHAELIPMPIDQFFQKIEEARNNPPQRQSWDDPLLLVDGIRVELTNGVWILLRKSNTSAVIVFKAEANSDEKRVELERTMRLLDEAMREVVASNPDFAGLNLKDYEKEIERVGASSPVQSAAGLDDEDGFLAWEQARTVKDFQEAISPFAAFDGAQRRYVFVHGDDGQREYGSWGISYLKDHAQTDIPSVVRQAATEALNDLQPASSPVQMHEILAVDLSSPETEKLTEDFDNEIYRLAGERADLDNKPQDYRQAVRDALYFLEEARSYLEDKNKTDGRRLYQIKIQKDGGFITSGLAVVAAVEKDRIIVDFDMSRNVTDAAVTKNFISQIIKDYPSKAVYFNPAGRSWDRLYATKLDFEDVRMPDGRELLLLGVSGQEEKGGIDLNPALLDLQIRRDGNGIPLPLLQQPIEHMRIEGFIPVIINITPVTNLPLLLGIADEGKPSDAADSGLQPLELGFAVKEN
ncbi:MAG: glucose-6-phosphate isomerase [Candidatus Omnitrophica bacterium]|nr:glucose-6-phosphate isomerase [Candidatus Omnitrophota bacterium]